MISLGLVGDSRSVNPAGDAFKARKQELDAGHQADLKLQQEAESRHDADMLRVFELAGDGYINEAQYFAKQKGINPPAEVFTNAELAKGLSLAGKIYPGDPAAAQKFTQTWMMTPGDLKTKLTAGQQAAGVPVNPEDRMLQRQISLEQWKLDHQDNSNAITPYQQANLDLAQQRLDMEKTRMGQQNAKDNMIIADGVIYEIQPGGGLVQKTLPKTGQDNFSEDVMKESYKARNAALSGFDPDSADQVGTGTADFAFKIKSIINKAVGPQQQNTSLVIDPMSASNAAIARQQANIGSNVNQTPDRAFQNTSPQVPAGLPPGTVYIGTSNGYPVYEDPEGNRYINDGSP